MILDQLIIFDNMHISRVSHEMHEILSSYIQFMQRRLSQLHVNVATPQKIKLEVLYRNKVGWGLSCTHEKTRFVPFSFLVHDMIWIDRTSTVRFVSPKMLQITVWHRSAARTHIVKYNIGVPLDWPKIVVCSNKISYETFVD